MKNYVAIPIKQMSTLSPLYPVADIIKEHYYPRNLETKIFPNCISIRDEKTGEELAKIKESKTAVRKIKISLKKQFDDGKDLSDILDKYPFVKTKENESLKRKISGYTPHLLSNACSMPEY